MSKKWVGGLNRKLTRREFLKLAAAGVLGLSLGGYFIRGIFKKHVKIGRHTKVAYHYQGLPLREVECHLCPNQCILSESQRGICRVRKNIGGKLYTLVYGNPCAVHIDPIEKKPLFHFLPGSGAYSIATAGCNFRCLNCQNWQISQFPPEQTHNISMFPTQVVENAVSHKCQSIAYTYSEPSIFYEYMYDTSKLAQESGLKNLWITNGYLSREPLVDFCQYLDAANVDLKSFDDSIYLKLNRGHLQPVLDTLKTLKEQNVWFEVTNLIIPTYTDDMGMIKDMCKWLVDNIGTEYPLHFSRFVPQYKLVHLPQTPYDTLKKAREIALEAGLKYVYIGNVPQLEGQQTYCPRCKKIVVKRQGYRLLENNIVRGRCKFCGEPIAGVWGL